MVTGIKLGPCSSVRMNLEQNSTYIEPQSAGFYLHEEAFTALLYLVRSNSMMVALFTSWSLNGRLSFYLHWSNYNEQNQENEKRAKKPINDWSYVLLA